MIGIDDTIKRKSRKMQSLHSTPLTCVCQWSKSWPMDTGTPNSSSTNQPLSSSSDHHHKCLSSSPSHHICPLISSVKWRSTKLTIANLIQTVILFFLFNHIIATIDAYENGKLEALTRTINPGDKVDIPCSVVTPGGSVQWILNNKPILLDFSQNQRRHWNISNDGQASLTINRITRADEGLWECWELDSAGNVRQKAPIMRIVLSNVPEEPYLEYNGHRLAAQQSITVREHSLIALNCITKGQFSSTRSIQWYIGGENLSSHSRTYSEYSTEEETSVTISVLSMNISAEYHTQMVYCQIAHSSWASAVTISASFNVLYAPLFSITREPGFGYPVIEGMPLSLRCDIDSNPPAEARWEREADPALSNATLSPIHTNHDGSLNFSAISKQDIGWYKCTTQHEFGFFASFGYFLNVRSRDELPQLAADILGGTHPQLSDENQDHLLNSAKEAALRKIYNQKQEGRETYEASVQDYGQRTYSDGLDSYGANKRGKECPPPAMEAGRPVIESINSTVIALVGSQISMIARFCCQPRPRKVYWIHRHLAMMPSRIIGRYITRELIMSSTSTNCFTSSFIIDSVKPEDAGDIMFMVLNQKGIDQALISLNVTYSASYSISSNAGASSSTHPSASMLLILFSLITIFALNFQWFSINHRRKLIT